MGCAITFPSQNPLLYESERQVLKAIKNCEIQTLAHFLAQYLELNSTQRYFIKINQVYNYLKDTEQTYLKNNSNGVNRKDERIFDSRSHHINYHMEQVLKNIKLADDLLEQFKSQRDRAEKKLRENKIDWNFTIGRIIENTNKKKMISQIVVDPKQIEKQAKMSEEQMVRRITQCKEKIQQSLSQLDANQVQRTNAVMTQVNKLEELIKKYKEQIDMLNEDIRNLNIRIKQNNQSANIAFEEKQKKYNRIQKLLDQTKQQNDNLTKQNTLLKQENQKMKFQLMMQKESLLTESRITQINIRHLNPLNLENKSSEIPQNNQEKKESSFEKSNSLKIYSSQSTQVEQNSKEKRSDTNQTAKSVEFKKFYQSSIIYKSFRVSKKYKNIIDEIFAPLKIENTIPLFLYDKVRPNNMNQYIKKQENLLILAQLKNGTIIGGFSRFGFKQSIEKLKENICFIFYIHSQKQYHKLELKQQSMAKYSAKLDQTYLKIGENEIRITCGKNEGFSSVGSSSSIFSRKDKKISAAQFLNMNKQSKQGFFELQTYEIFQLSVQYPEEVLKKCKVQLQSVIYE